MSFGTITEIWRYPVKSLLGERVESTPVSTRGLAHDREHAIVWPDGQIASGKTTRRFRRLPNLFRLSASQRKDGLTVCFPDGREIEGPSSTLDVALTEHFAERVALAREESVSHFDAGPVHILTTASLRWLAKQNLAKDADTRRFRPNLVVDCEGESQVEQAWAGRRMEVGDDLVLRITDPTERCVMTTLKQDELQRNTDVLEKIARNGNAFGVYADVEQSGRVTVGDSVLIT